MCRTYFLLLRWLSPVISILIDYFFADCFSPCRYDISHDASFHYDADASDADAFRRADYQRRCCFLHFDMMPMLLITPALLIRFRLFRLR